jgi:hypothetical protein
MKTMYQLRVTFSFAWWVQPYIWALAIACWVMGTQPDVDKLRAKLRRGIRFKITRVD